LKTLQSEESSQPVTTPPVGNEECAPSGGESVSRRAFVGVALDAKCTHLGCTVQYEADKNRIYCACHGGVYDARTGANVSGPPPKPLKRYVVRPAPEGGVVVSRS
jgi:Rieske Fe-S protein